MTKTDRTALSVSVLAFGILLAVMNLTTPSEIGPLGVLVFFTLAYVTCFGVISLLGRAFFLVKGKIQGDRSRQGQKKCYYYGSVLAFAPMILVFMRASGGLNVFEVGLVVVFVVISCFYVSKKT